MCHGIRIEIFHRYFKIRDFGNVESYIQKRQKAFKKYGWKTIFVNEIEINNEENIVKKIRRGGD